MFELPKLKYGMGDLKQCMSEEAIQFHYGKHHQAYTDKLNLALDANPKYKGQTIEDLLTNIDAIDESARTALRNQGGGYYNHSLFWETMSPKGGGEPSGRVSEIINSNYGSFQGFAEEFTNKSMSVFGSGWTWLLQNGNIITTANQDTPVSMGYEVPLLCLDLWEHAYYIDYRNRRDEFIKAWWNVVDWQAVNDRVVNR
ncbi:superoxide dismutase [Candidatus Saccharibacteria bacterium]|nr:superoxide dismutase [Candidatus Saccharibacteria bacterium]